MNLEKLKNDNIPNEFSVLIEIQANSPAVKYELDKDTNCLVVDRFISTSMYYPCHYGYIPNTLAKDGDPTDILLVADFDIQPGSLINVRPVGVLDMEDEKGQDVKIICVPVSKVTPLYDNIKTVDDLPVILLNKIQHFFERYKDLEENKWTKVTGIKGIDEAKVLIQDSVSCYKSK